MDENLVLSSDGKTLYEVHNVENLVIPDGVVKIDRCAVSSRGVVTAVIPDSVEEIGREAFRICKSLQSVVIGSGVKKMGQEAFAGCDNLSEVTIKEGAKVIGTLAFYRDKALEHISLPQSLTKIGEDAFCGSGLTSIVIPIGVKSIGPSAFVVRDIAEKGGLSVLKSVEFADGCKLTTIEDKAFKGASIETLTLPKKIKKIGSWAFANCKNLKTVVLPEGLEAFGEFSTFENCESLESIHIPASLTELGWKPFEGCSKLTHITIDPANPAYVLQDGKIFTKDLQKQII